MYNIRLDKDRKSILLDAAKLEDECPVDAVCDSIPDVILYVTELEEKVRGYRGQVQKLQADVRFLEGKVNNLKSQKFRQNKKKGK